MEKKRKRGGKVPGFGRGRKRGRGRPPMTQAKAKTAKSTELHHDRAHAVMNSQTIKFTSKKLASRANSPARINQFLFKSESISCIGHENKHNVLETIWEDKGFGPVINGIIKDNNGPRPVVSSLIREHDGL